VNSLGPSTLDPLIQKLGQHVELDAADRAAILALPVSVKTLERHQFIVREGEQATHSCVMLSGFSVRTKDVESGARQIVSIHMKGDLVDLQNSLLDIADHGVEMLTTSNLALIPRDEIVRIAFARPAVGRAMWIDTLIDAAIFREWIANIGVRDARTRIAHLLCEFAVRMNKAGLADGDKYELPMSQEQLGEATGLTSVHINRTIRGLEGDGLIERSSARSIRIGDWKRLAEVGDFDNSYLHLNQQRVGLGAQPLSA
jgi:CRP-like cAMP-binding protein